MTVPYCGLTTAGLWLTDWNLEPALIAVIGATAVMALRGPAALRLHRWTAAGLMALLWLSPLCAASATLLSVRVAHHMILMLLLAPALALGWPTLRIGGPVGWAIASALVLAAWFVPAIYSFVWESHAGYWLLQLAMLGAAWQFWSAWFGPDAARRPLAMAAAPALLSMAMGFVGALLTFAPRPMFAEHIFTTVLFDVSPLWDQQLAGLVMWTAGMVPLAVLAMTHLGRLTLGTSKDAQC